MNGPMDRVTLDVKGVHVTVSAEDVMRLLLDRMRGSSTEQVRPTGVPRIGTAWPEQGGEYAGIVRGHDGGPDYHLILAEQTLAPGPWTDALAWAKSLVVGRFSDYSLPLRKEQAVMFGNVPERFEKDWYWSSEEHSNTAYAWCQNFTNGTQDDTHKTNTSRARAVRRVPIQ